MPIEIVFFFFFLLDSDPLAVSCSIEPSCAHQSPRCRKVSFYNFPSRVQISIRSATFTLDFSRNARSSHSSVYSFCRNKNNEKHLSRLTCIWISINCAVINVIKINWIALHNACSALCWLLIVLNFSFRLMHWAWMWSLLDVVKLNSISRNFINLVGKIPRNSSKLRERKKCNEKVSKMMLDSKFFYLWTLRVIVKRKNIKTTFSVCSWKFMSFVCFKFRSPTRKTLGGWFSHLKWLRIILIVNSCILISF